ncbi:MAG: GAF domain-containing sensor histidine kinase [Acidimicrobiia bacterium]|nr:GAF domain-containing sensor histidine kinase [Acidimicrobiia bacterium]
MKLGESISGHVARTREAVVLSGDVDGERFPGKPTSEQAPTSAVCAPLEHRGELLGVINVSRDSSDYDEYDLQTLRLFAEPAAAAIANGRLYEAERAHVAELLELDRMKTEFMASMGHELRTPLTSIRGAVAASRRPVLADEERGHLLEVVDRQAERLHAMVEEMLTSADQRTPGVMPMLRPIDLAALVRLVALDSQVAGRPVEVDAPPRCDVRGDPESIRRIVGNLIENAFKYGEPPSGSWWGATTTPWSCRSKTAAAAFPNPNGRRSSSATTGQIGQTARPVTAWVSPIVRGLVTACGGTVWVEDATNGGAAFRVTLPVRSEVDEPAPNREEPAWAASQKS